MDILLNDGDEIMEDQNNELDTRRNACTPISPKESSEVCYKSNSLIDPLSKINRGLLSRSKIGCVIPVGKKQNSG